MISIVRMVCLCLGLGGLIACDRPAKPLDISPLVYDHAQVASAEKIAVFIPGAFSSVEIFDAAANWSKRGYGLVYYRLPGMDGMPIEPGLSIEHAAAEIASFALGQPGKPLALIGYSTGGPIALRAAERVQDGRQVSVAAISSAVERGGGLPTLSRGARDVAGAIVDAKSLNRDQYWELYWQSLLFGPDAVNDPDHQARIAALTQRYGPDITVPNASLVHAHTRDLARWRVGSAPKLDHAKIGFFIGLNDPVFSKRQTIAFRDKIGTGQIFGYQDGGHLLFLTHPDLFDAVFQFVDN